MNPRAAIYNALMDGFNGRPALISAEEADKVTALMAAMMVRRDAPSADEVARSEEEGVRVVEHAYGMNFDRSRAKPFLFSQGVAYIPMRGVLVHGHGDPWSGTRGYDDIRREFDAAMADPDVSGIVFDIHSGGGMVYGNFELADHIFAGRDKKPSLAVVNAGAMSGAYSLGSAAKKMVTTPSGDTGSIGVLTMHIDASKALENFGVKVTLIHAGAHKVDGNPFTPLSDGVRADMQARVDGMWSKFIATVARHRGMSEQAIRDTQARVYRADDAVKIGLVDAIASPQEAVAAFRAEIFGSSNPDEERSTSMTTKTDEQIKADQDEAARNAVIADRKRRNDIMSSEEAKGRTTLASHLADSTDMSVDQARAALAAAPIQKAENATNPLENAMDASGGGANVSNNGGNGEDAAAEQRKKDEEANGGSLLSAYGDVTGVKFKK